MKIFEQQRQTATRCISYRLPFLLTRILCMLTTPLWAEQSDETEEVTCDRDVYLCEDFNEWQVSLALGIGGRTNPLINSSDIPLFIMPKFAYYGENFFIDNLNLGYNLVETNQLSLNVITDINYDRVFFSRTDPGNVLFDTLISDGVEVGNLPSEGQVDSISISPSSLNRKISYLAGLGLIWTNHNHRMDVEIFTDISNIHDGQEARIKYEYIYHQGDWTINPELELVWKSADINSYYYGFTDDEFQIDYQAESGISAAIGLNVINKINEQWFWLGKLSYLKLSDEVANSPLVDKSYSVTTFLGLVYTF